MTQEASQELKKYFNQIDKEVDKAYAIASDRKSVV